MTSAQRLEMPSGSKLAMNLAREAISSQVGSSISSRKSQSSAKPARNAASETAWLRAKTVSWPPKPAVVNTKTESCISQVTTKVLRTTNFRDSLKAGAECSRRLLRVVAAGLRLFTAPRQPGSILVATAGQGDGAKHFFGVERLAQKVVYTEIQRLHPWAIIGQPVGQNKRRRDLHLQHFANQISPRMAAGKTNITDYNPDKNAPENRQSLHEIADEYQDPPGIGKRRA